MCVVPVHNKKQLHMWQWLNVRPFLSNAVCTRHRLQVILRVEVAIVEYDRISSSQVEALTSAFGTQQKGKCVGIAVEFIDGQISFLSTDRSIKPLVHVTYVSQCNNTIRCLYSSTFFQKQRLLIIQIRKLIFSLTPDLTVNFWENILEIFLTDRPSNKWRSTR